MQNDNFNDPMSPPPAESKAYEELAQVADILQSHLGRVEKAATKSIRDSQRLVQDVVADGILASQDAIRSELSLIPKAPDTPKTGATTPPPQKKCEPGGVVNRIKGIDQVGWSNITNTQGCLADLDYTLTDNAIRVSWQVELAGDTGQARLAEDNGLATGVGNHVARVWIPPNPPGGKGTLLIVTLQATSSGLQQCVDRIPVPLPNCGQTEPPVQEPPVQQPPTEQPKNGDCCDPIVAALKCICDALQNIKLTIPKPEPPKPKRFSAWIDLERGECYVQDEQRPPHKPNDELIGTFDQAADADAALAKTGLCRKSPQRPDEPTGPPTQPSGLGQVGFGCDPAFYSRVLERSKEIGQYVDAWSKESVDTLPFVTLAKVVGKLLTGIFPGFDLLGMESLVDEVRKQALENPTKWAKLSQGLLECTDPVQVSLLVARTIMGTIEKWIGPMPPQLVAFVEYAVRGACPYIYPTASEADQAYLANTISAELWEVWQRQNGVCPAAHAKVVEAGQAKLSLLMIFDLHRRGQLSEAEARSRIRELGYLKPETFQEAAVLAEFIPGPSDLVRFMQRDVADGDLVTKFRMDEDFDKKVKDNIPAQMAAQGVTMDVMRQYWRAHWQIPSNTQLYEMFHRNRLRDVNDPLYTDQDTIKTAMQQNDVLPYWIDRLISVSFNPLGRIDTRRAFEMGVINEREVYEAYVAQGYDDKNADILKRFTVELKNAALDNSQEVRDYEQGIIGLGEASRILVGKGFPANRVDSQLRHSRRKRIERIKSTIAYRQWVDGAGDWNSVDLWMQREAYSSDEITEVNRTGLIEIDGYRKAACSKATRERFIRGEIDARLALIELQGYGIDADTATARVEGWKCELSAMPKDLPASYVKQGWDLGIITDFDAQERLFRLGFSREATREIVSLWTIERKLQLAEDLEKQRQDEAKRLLAEEAKRRKEADKEKRQADQAAKKAATARDGLEKLLLAANAKARAWATKLEIDPASSGDIVQDVINQVGQVASFTAANQLRVAIKAFERAASEKTLDVVGIARDLAIESDI